MDKYVICLNEKIERYVNGLISLQSSNLWPNVSSINSSAPIIITHYVLTTLGTYRQMIVEKLDEIFRN